MFNAIKGFDEKDSGSVMLEEKSKKKIEDIKIGWIDEVQNIFGNVNSEKVTINTSEYSKSTAYIISAAETSSNLSKYDGIRYGHRAENATTWQEVYSKTRQEGFGYEVKKKIIAGTYFTDAENMENYYRKADKIRTLIKQEMKEVFTKIDILAIPANSKEVILANLTGRPAITVKGITLIGDFFKEESLIEFVQETLV